MYIVDGFNHIENDLVDLINLSRDLEREVRNNLNRLSGGLVLTDNYDAIRSMLKNYDAENSIALLSRMIESKLRQMAITAGIPGAETAAATDLASLCFNEKTGAYSPPFNLATNSNNGMCLILIGFMQYVRNGILHNAGVFNKTDVLVVHYVYLAVSIYEILIKSVRRKLTLLELMVLIAIK